MTPPPHSLLASGAGAEPERESDMSKPNATLLDAVYRCSFASKTNNGWRSNLDMRHALEATRRFTLDERMSSFLAELSNEAFIKVGPSSKLAVRIADSLRVQARLPHESIWVEYMLRAYQLRSAEIRGSVDQNDPDMQPLREGWLIQQHPKIESAYIAHIFTQDDKLDKFGYSLFTFPLAYAWMADDNPLPWRLVCKPWLLYDDDPLWAPGGKFHVSANMIGIPGFQRENVCLVQSPLFVRNNEIPDEYTGNLLREWTGVLRRMWALLATIDHLPIVKGEVRLTKGFLARGRIRKYLSHQTITLNVPAKKDTRILARQVIAMAHRKRHEVRGHWRDDWRNPPSRICNPHLWETMDENVDRIRCATCGGQQSYVHKHERGDASLGYVTHDYLVSHPVENPKQRRV